MALAVPYRQVNSSLVCFAGVIAKSGPTAEFTRRRLVRTPGSIHCELGVGTTRNGPQLLKSQTHFRACELYKQTSDPILSG